MPQKKSQETEIPDGVPAGLWDMLLSIKADTSATSQRVDQLETRVEELEEIQMLDRDVINKVEILQQKVELLSARLEKCEKSSDNMYNQIDDLRAHSMKENLLFTFDSKEQDYKEVKEENSPAIVKAFLRKVLEIENDMSVPVAHRIGKYVKDKTRPMIAKFPVAKERELVLSRTTRLTDTKHFVTKQMTAKQRERKQLVLPVYKELKKSTENNAKIRDDKLYVKGALQSQYMPQSLPRGNVNPALVLHEGGRVEDGGSTFEGYVAGINSLKDAADILHMVKNIPRMASATHLLYTFRIKNRGDKTTENYDSDGDYGVGLNMLEHMQKNKIINVIFVASRDCPPGFVHIGDKRMEHAITVCARAMPEL